MLAEKARLAVDERHGVLQLIAETESAAGLVVSAARPQTAGKRLVEKPAVGQHIERRIRSFHVDRAQGMFPVLPDCFEGRARGFGPTEALGQRSEEPRL